MTSSSGDDDNLKIPRVVMTKKIKDETNNVPDISFFCGACDSEDENDPDFDKGGNWNYSHSDLINQALATHERL